MFSISMGSRCFGCKNIDVASKTLKQFSPGFNRPLINESTSNVEPLLHEDGKVLASDDEGRKCVSVRSDVVTGSPNRPGKGTK